MPRLSSMFCVTAAILSAACSDAGDGSGAPLTEDGPLDVRVPMLDPEAEAIDLVSGEQTVAPGEEKIFCTHFRYDGEDIAFWSMASAQGKFGHHATLMSALEPLPPGTVEDCTKPEDMAKYSSFAFGGLDLPPGHGSLLPKGKTVVLQSHYVNTGARALLVRDRVRIKTMPVADVTTWTSVFRTNKTDFTIQPHDKTSLTYDCVLQKEADLLVLGGHMHEHGNRIEIFHGADEASLKSIYLVEPWQSDFRDAPPITLMFESPMKVAAGSIIRTTCEWTNSSDKAMGYPSEMCVAFGYAAGTQEVLGCMITK